MNLSEKIYLANCILPEDVFFLLKKAKAREKNKKAKKFFSLLFENIKIAGQKKVPICQDTGLCVFYVPPDTNEKFLLNSTKVAYKNLRNSQKISIFKNRSVISPVIYRLRGLKKIKFLIRGGGAMNSSCFISGNPAWGKKQIVEIICQEVIKRAPFTCPPVFVGVGIGGTPSQAMFLSEFALLCDLRKKMTQMENEIFEKINKSGIGAGAWGGKNTVLSVKIKQSPLHIATLPIGITISCWCLRKGQYGG
ncbi:MAG: fumarate hydratase [Elusimicrobia bacterium]|nr:fumarate hydratase [Elusimicrobiota bacterium]